MRVFQLFKITSKNNIHMTEKENTYYEEINKNYYDLTIKDSKTKNNNDNTQDTCVVVIDDDVDYVYCKKQNYGYFKYIEHWLNMEEKCNCYYCAQ